MATKRKAIKVGAVLAIGLAASACADAVVLDDGIYIEFLWSKPPAHAIARQQTQQFVLQGHHDPIICVAATARDSDVSGLQVEVLDARGSRVSLQQHADYRGTKQCYPADLGKGGVAGEWTVRAVLGDGHTQSARLRVDQRLEDSPNYHRLDQPYVVGRPNYDASIPPEAWLGKLVWVMDVDPLGKVTHVEVEQAEGVGEHLRARALAAGYLTLFPPDPARATTPLRWRRTLTFSPD